MEDFVPRAFGEGEAYLGDRVALVQMKFKERSVRSRFTVLHDGTEAPLFQRLVTRDEEITRAITCDDFNHFSLRVNRYPQAVRCSRRVFACGNIRFDDI